MFTLSISCTKTQHLFDTNFTYLIAHMLNCKQHILLEPENLVSFLVVFGHSVTEVSCSFKILITYRRKKELLRKGSLEEICRIDCEL